MTNKIESYIKIEEGDILMLRTEKYYKLYGVIDSVIRQLGTIELNHQKDYYELLIYSGYCLSYNDLKKVSSFIYELNNSIALKEDKTND